MLCTAEDKVLQVLSRGLFFAVTRACVYCQSGPGSDRVVLTGSMLEGFVGQW